MIYRGKLVVASLHSRVDLHLCRVPVPHSVSALRKEASPPSLHSALLLLLVIEAGHDLVYFRCDFLSCLFQCHIIEMLSAGRGGNSGKKQNSHIEAR